MLDDNRDSPKDLFSMSGFNLCMRITTSFLGDDHYNVYTFLPHRYRGYWFECNMTIGIPMDNPPSIPPELFVSVVIFFLESIL